MISRNSNHNHKERHDRPCWMCCRFVKSSARRKKCFRCQSIWWIGFCRQFRRGRHDYNCSDASVSSLRPNCSTRCLWQLTNWWCTPTSPSAPMISWYAFELIHRHQLSVIVPHILTSLVLLLPVHSAHWISSNDTVYVWPTVASGVTCTECRSGS